MNKLEYLNEIGISIDDLLIDIEINSYSGTDLTTRKNVIQESIDYMPDGEEKTSYQNRLNVI